MAGAFFLMLAALIWGTAFVAQSVGMDYIGPCTFNAVRSYIGGLVLLPLIFWNRRLQAGKPQEADPARGRKLLAGRRGPVRPAAGGREPAAAGGHPGLPPAGRPVFNGAVYRHRAGAGHLFGPQAGLKVWIGVGIAWWGRTCSV